VPTSDYDNDKVKDVYDINKEIFEQDGKGDTNIIILGDWNSVVGDKSYRNFAGPHG
jgi:hypothetical protein